jgi:uncharacterized protein (TIGR00255 family)
MPSSMTGFGAAEGPVAGGSLRIEIRSVNHRFFNLSLRVPAELSEYETEIRDRLRKEFERGHLAVSARWIAAPAVAGSAGWLDPARARAVADRLRELQSAAGLSGEISLDLLLKQADALGGPNSEGPGTIEWAEVAPILQEAADRCREARLREGSVLVRELDARLAAIAGEAERLQALAPRRVQSERERLRQAVAQLLDGRPVDDQRLAQEIAFLAERHDVTEELVRLEAHLAACREALRTPGPVGKQLGFLAQELGREMNTIGAKANDAGMQHVVVAMKGELERFREQLENLE